MNSSEIASIFIRHNSFLAHCSSYQPLVGSPLTQKLAPLERLTNVIKTKPEICCSSISANDTFEKNNFTGKIGLIIIPHSLDSITFVSPTDGGTQAPQKQGDPRFVGKRKDISANDLNDAITNRKHREYNEICVKQYDILGVFFCAPPIDFATANHPYISRVTPADIVGALPKQRYFLFQNGTLTEVYFNPNTINFSTSMAISEIYKHYI